MSVLTINSGSQPRLYLVFQSPPWISVLVDAVWSDGYTKPKVINRTLADPSLITLKVLDPSNVVLATHVYPAGDGVLVRDGLGLYHADLAFTNTGRAAAAYQVQVSSTGPCTDVELISLQVVPTPA